MTRCGGTTGGCTCAVTAGAGISVTGDGSPQTPYTVATSGAGVSVTAADTPTVDMTVAGAGTSGSPYVLAGTVNISADAGNGISAGSDGGLFTVSNAPPAGVVWVTGTVTAVDGVTHMLTVDVDGGPTGAQCFDTGWTLNPSDRLYMLLVTDGTYVVLGTP